MVRIRLRRVGARHQPSYRIVVADKESPRDGRFLEIIGNYNPRTEPATIEIDEARLFHWMKNGAQPSDSMLKLMRTSGALDRWERFKGGESLEKLLAEAEEAHVEVDPRTRRDDLVGARQKASKPAGAEPKEESAPEVETPEEASKEDAEEVAEEAAEAAPQEATEAEADAADTEESDDAEEAKAEESEESEEAEEAEDEAQDEADDDADADKEED